MLAQNSRTLDQRQQMLLVVVRRRKGPCIGFDGEILRKDGSVCEKRKDGVSCLCSQPQQSHVTKPTCWCLSLADVNQVTGLYTVFSRLRRATSSDADRKVVTVSAGCAGNTTFLVTHEKNSWQGLIMMMRECRRRRQTV